MPKGARADGKVTGLEGSRPCDSLAAGVSILENLNPSLGVLQGTMRLSPVAARHLRIGLNLEKGFRIAELSSAQMESIGRKRREARKRNVEGHE